MARDGVDVAAGDRSGERGRRPELVDVVERRRGRAAANASNGTPTASREPLDLAEQRDEVVGRDGGGGVVRDAVTRRRPGTGAGRAPLRASYRRRARRPRTTSRRAAPGRRRATATSAAGAAHRPRTSGRGRRDVVEHVEAAGAGEVHDERAGAQGGASAAAASTMHGVGRRDEHQRRRRARPSATRPSGRAERARPRPRVDGASSVRPATATARQPARRERERRGWSRRDRARRARTSAAARSRVTLLFEPLRSGPSGCRTTRVLRDDPMVGRSGALPASRTPARRERSPRGSGRGRRAARARTPARTSGGGARRGPARRRRVPDEQHVDVERPGPPPLAPDPVRRGLEPLARARAARGASSTVSTATTALRYSGCSGPPTGSVS